MTTKFPRLYKDRRGKYYFTFHRQKIFIKDLSKADIIRFYNRLVRLHKLKKAKQMKKHKRKPKKKQTEEQRLAQRDAARVQPWVTSGPAVNPNVHEEEIKKQNAANKIQQALEEQNQKILQIGYNPDDIRDMGNQLQRLNYAARQGMYRLDFLENRAYEPNIPLTRSENEEKAPEKISEEEEDILQSVPPSQSSSEPPAPLPPTPPITPIAPSIAPLPAAAPKIKEMTKKEIGLALDYLGNLGDNKSTGRSLLAQISKKLGSNISGKVSGPTLKRDILKKEMTPEGLQLIKELLEQYKESESEPEAQQSASGKVGIASSTDKPLYDDEINNIMRKYSDYRGTIANDDIKTLLPSIKPQSRVAFIINTDKHNSPGSHWISIYVDARPNGSQSIEYFDSFGRDPSPEIMRDLRLVVDMLHPETYLKLKISPMIHQTDSTNTSSWHAMHYLIDRFRGKTFAEASGYNPDKKIEGHEDKFEDGVKKMKWAYM